MAAKQILILQTAFVGDLLLSIPLFQNLRRLFPESRIVLYCRKGLGSVLLQSGIVDEVIEADKGDAASLKRAAKDLQSREFDLLISPHQSFRTALLASRLRARRKIGYRRWWNGFAFHERVNRPMHLPEALRQLALLTEVDPEIAKRLILFAAVSQAGGLEAGSQSRQAEVGFAPVPAWASMRIDKIADLRQHPERLSETTRQLRERYGWAAHRLALLAPGSVWPTKMWTLDGYQQIARQLLSEGWAVAVLGAPGEKDICEAVSAMVPGVVNLAGRTSLYESAELLAVSELLICNDSGAMHMAAVAGTPTVSVFGPTTLELGYRPWQNAAAVVQVDLDCRPCGKHGSKQCPLGTHACMKGVSAADVHAAAIQPPVTPNIPSR